MSRSYLSPLLLVPALVLALYTGCAQDFDQFEPLTQSATSSGAGGNPAGSTSPSSSSASTGGGNGGSGGGVVASSASSSSGGTMCNDGIKNGDESDVDCGGSCPDCSNGSTCQAETDCNSGYCTDGVCCNFPCNAICRACNIPGDEGTCTDLPLNDEDLFPMACSGTSACDGNGVCKLKNGEACTQDSECLSDNCQNGQNVCAP